MEASLIVDPITPSTSQPQHGRADEHHTDGTHNDVAAITHNESDLVSVIIPTYNRAHYLQESIESVLAQKYKPIELIIVDDGSTDDTPQLLEKYAKHPEIIILRHDTNMGISAARNTGCEYAHGTWIKTHDSDDILLPDAIGTIMSTISALPPQHKVHQTFFLHNFAFFRDDGDGHHAPLHYKQITSDFNVLPRISKIAIFFSNCIPGSFLFHKDMFEMCGQFNTLLTCCEDYDFLGRGIIQNSCEMVLCGDKPLSKVRKHGRNVEDTNPVMPRIRHANTRKFLHMLPPTQRLSVISRSFPLECNPIKKLFKRFLFFCAPYCIAVMMHRVYNICKKTG